MSADQEALALRYALLKQVPDMQRGAIIETSYGRITLDAGDSIRVAALVHKLIKRKLEKMQKKVTA